MTKNKYFLYLVFVILIWGIVPMLAVHFYTFLSAAVYTSISALISALSFTVIAWKKRKLADAKCIKAAVGTGMCYSVATILQMIGLQYTTPSMFAFLENLTCVAVPVLMVILVRKKPHPLVAAGSILCLVGCFVLSGADFGTPPGIGEILCALAGILFSGNIAGTGVYAKEVYVPLYLMIQKWVHVVLSAAVMLALHFTRINGAPLEAMTLQWRPGLFLLMTVFVLVSGSLCWLLRTEVLKKLDPTVVTVAMPLSAVITMVLSVLAGTDVLSAHLAAGAGMILFSVILSGIGDVLDQKQGR